MRDPLPSPPRQSFASKGFEVVGASVSGHFHQSKGEACQDYFVIDGSDDWVVAVVSDGAGSATRALDGARIISTVICNAVALHLTQAATFNISPREQLFGVRDVVRNAIEIARHRCSREANSGENLRNFHATLVGGVFFNAIGLLFHIGDGGASAHRRTNLILDTISFSEPENGEYINETFFFTEAYWYQHLRFTEIDGIVDAIWLMTDGAYALAIPPLAKQLRDITEAEINRIVFEDASKDRVERLAAILGSRQATERNDDDKTLVIVRIKK